MTNSPDTIALSSLKRGDLFNIDGGATLVFIDAEYNENTPEVRITYTFLDEPRFYYFKVLADIMDHSFYAGKEA